MCSTYSEAFSYVDSFRDSVTQDQRLKTYTVCRSLWASITRWTGGHAPYFWNWGTTQIMFFAPPLTFCSEKLVFFRCAPIVVRVERCQFNLRLKLITSEAKNIWRNDQKEFKTLHVLWVLLLTAVIVSLCIAVYATVYCRRLSVSRRRGTNMEQFANRSIIPCKPSQNQIKMSFIFGVVSILF